MQIKTTMGCHCMPVGMSKIKKNDYTKWWWNCSATRTLIHREWECKMVQTLWNLIGLFLYKLNTHVLYDLVIFLDIYPKVMTACWRRQWHPTPVLLPGKSHGWRSLVGCSPWDHEESDTTEWPHFHFSLSCTGEGNGNPIVAIWVGTCMFIAVVFVIATNWKPAWKSINSWMDKQNVV